MLKPFNQAIVCVLLLILFVSACQPSPVVTPTPLATGAPTAASPLPPTPAPLSATALPATLTPTATAMATAQAVTQTAPAHPQISADAVRIQLNDTTMQVSPGDLAANATKQWVFGVEKGQKVAVTLTSEPANGAVFSIWGADGKVLAPETPELANWEGVVPTAQDYYIGVRSVSAQSIPYTLVLRIPPLTPPQATRIQFQPKTTGWHTGGNLATFVKNRYVLGAQAGQQMTVNLATTPPESAFLYIWSADGTVYTLLSPTQTWNGTLPASQDYYIEVRSVSKQSISYQLSVDIPAVASQPAATGGPKIAVNKPIRFAAGPLDVELKGAVIRGERDRYTLSMVKGEILSVVISSLESNAAFTILDPDQNPVPGTEDYKDTIQWSIPIPADGAYAILVSPTRGNATYTLKVQVSSH